MTTETIATPTYTETEALLLALPASINLSRDWISKKTTFRVSAYPGDDLMRDRVNGDGETLAEAIADLMHNLDLAKDQGPELRTAREVKEAVVKLIGEHKAAPASFRAAVDGLRVSDR